jgi:hypothetical protein
MGPNSAATNPYQQQLTPTAATNRSGLPLPRSLGNIIPYDIHRSVSAEQLKPGRMIVVGDVHGCHDELSSLLIKCGYDQRSDNLVFVGDLVNKGPKSQQVGAVAGASRCRAGQLLG